MRAVDRFMDTFGTCNMDFKGGYNVSLLGRPSSSVHPVPEPKSLCVPLVSDRFSFSELCVADKDRVTQGETLATDPANFSVPLLAPRGGRVTLDTTAGHVTLTDLDEPESVSPRSETDLEHVAATSSSVESRHVKTGELLKKGAWQKIYDAHSSAVPDPDLDPRAVIVSTVSAEPFRCRGDVLLRQGLNDFLRGLEHIQSLLEYQQIYVAMPPSQSELAKKLLDMLRGHAFVKVVFVDITYPYYNFNVLARALGFKPDAEQPVWAMGVDGVLAVDLVLNSTKAAVDRIVSLGGPGVVDPCHLKVMTGYPLDQLFESRLSVENPRVVNGGVLRGSTVPTDQFGIDAECDGFTVLNGTVEREMLGFMRPGFDRRSYSKCFGSLLRDEFAERLTVALRGERRACVSCGECVSVCPAGIMPNLIHKYIFQDEIEEAESARIDLCIRCGLCSYVCPSKIDLLEQIIDTQTALDELHAEETVS